MKFTSIVLVGWSLSVSSVLAGPYSLGISIGDPTGISYKRWLGQTTALQVAMGWQTNTTDSAHIIVDQVMHDMEVFPVDVGRLMLYYGIGGRAMYKVDITTLGLRIPVGMVYELPKAPFEVSAELVPVVDVAPDTRFDIDVLLALRYRFK